MNDFDYDYDASYETDYDPTAKRPAHWLNREQVQSLVEESQLKTYLENQDGKAN